jgi:hypothetical protein
MSDRLVGLVWSNFPGKGADLNIFQAIAEAANDQGNVYIAMSPLAAAARITLATACPAIRRLRSARWVIASPILGQGQCLAYQINIPKLERSARRDNDPDVPESDAILAARKASARRTRKYGAPSA